MDSDGSDESEVISDVISDIPDPIKYLALNKNQPELQALAARAGIDLSGFTWPITTNFRGLFRPIEQLVEMGLDTDENLALLFGDAAAVRSTQDQVRICTILGAPEGTPAYNLGFRGMDAVDPDAPASDVIMRLLPDWRRPATADEQEQECSICQEVLSSPVQQLHGCKHVFHVNCITEWLSRKSTCPCCRKALPLVAPRPATASELERIAEVESIQRMIDDLF